MDLSKMTFTELKAKYPEIQAKSKAAFIAKIIGSEMRERIGQEHDLTTHYRENSSDFIKELKVLDKDHVNIVVGDEKYNYYKVLALRRNGTTKVLRASRTNSKKEFLDSL